MADIKSVLKTLFPFISTAASLGGPLGTLAASAVGKALGVGSIPNDSKSIAAAVAGATPDQIIALQKAEQDFQLQMQQMGFANIEELEKIAAGDRADARDREIKTGDPWTPRILAALVVVGWMLVQWFLLSHVIQDTMRPIVMRSLGTLDMALGLVLGYYFGSSAGSDRKSELLAQSQPLDKE